MAGKALNNITGSLLVCACFRTYASVILTNENSTHSTESLPVSQSEYTLCITARHVSRHWQCIFRQQDITKKHAPTFP